MAFADITIGELARRTGCKMPTIRYFEQVGLLPAPRRSPGNQRLYGALHVARLAFIRHSRELGFSQAAIREFLALIDHPDQPCDAVTRIALSHLRRINEHIARLSALKMELERMISACRGGQVSECRIVETLADQSHGHCLNAHH